MYWLFLAVKPCFARCLSRGFLLLNLCLVIHVVILLSLCELASLSVFRRNLPVGRPDRTDRKGRNRKHECERVRISGHGPALEGMAGLDNRLGQAKDNQQSYTACQRRLGHEHGMNSADTAVVGGQRLTYGSKA